MRFSLALSLYMGSIELIGNHLDAFTCTKTVSLILCDKDVCKQFIHRPERENNYKKWATSLDQSIQYSTRRSGTDREGDGWRYKETENG